MFLGEQASENVTTIFLWEFTYNSKMLLREQASENVTIVLLWKFTYNTND